MRKIRLVHANERPKNFGEQADAIRRRETDKFRFALVDRHPDARHLFMSTSYARNVDRDRRKENRT